MRARLASIGALTPEDLSVLEGRDEKQRVALLSERLKDWKSVSPSRSGETMTLSSRPARACEVSQPKRVPQH